MHNVMALMISAINKNFKLEKEMWDDDKHKKENINFIDNCTHIKFFFFHLSFLSSEPSIKWERKLYFPHSCRRFPYIKDLSFKIDYVK